MKIGLDCDEVFCLVDALNALRGQQPYHSDAYRFVDDLFHKLKIASLQFEDECEHCHTEDDVPFN